MDECINDDDDEEHQRLLFSGPELRMPAYRAKDTGTNAGFTDPLIRHGMVPVPEKHRAGTGYRNGLRAARKTRGLISR